MSPTPPSVEESPASRWRRRAVTIPVWLLAFVAVVALLPILLPLALASDLLRDRRFPATRVLLLAVAYLACEAAGIVASLVLGIATLGSRERMLRWHHALQDQWARALLAAARRIFSFRLVVEGDAQVGRGPVLLFVRHASLADTLLPAVLVAHRHGLRLRWVMKRELLRDPCLDLVGQRLPNVFVRRGSDEGAREIAAVRLLAADLGPSDGVVIYPEGTRFTAGKQARIRDVLARSDPERAARLAGLRHVLPPRAGGPLALLEASPHADVVFLAHVGFEGAASLRDVCGGALIGRTVHVTFRRVPATEVPTGPRARLQWIDAEWCRVDDWIDRHRGALAR